MEFVFGLTRLVFLPGLIHNRPDQWIWGASGIFHDARNDQVMISIEISFIYTFCFPVNVGCIRVCLGVIIYSFTFSEYSLVFVILL